jgi:hypothetical protein
MLEISALLIGVALGIRHNVIVLVPCTLISAFASVGFSLAHGETLWIVFVGIMLTTMALQIGYLIGAFFAPSRIRQSAAHSWSSVENGRQGAEILYLNHYLLAKTR